VIAILASATDEPLAVVFLARYPVRTDALTLIGGRVAEKPITIRTVVLASPTLESRTAPTNIFSRSKWKVQLQFTDTLGGAQTWLSFSPDVVISDVRLPDGHWQG
jgi:hypothetical protein